jgi:hypothetical protein
MDRAMEKVIHRDEIQDEAAHDIAQRRRAQGDVPHTRTCMGCDKTFESEGWHNRLCQQCRKRSSGAG